jgi:hypothetical protein
MKVYIIDYPEHAGKWVYKGYQNAWADLGYDVCPIRLNKDLGQICTGPGFSDAVNITEKEYIVMYIDSLCCDPEALEIIEKSYKSFIFAMPNAFPAPWGTHANYMCHATDKTIHALNNLENVYLWTFGDWTTNHYKWKKVHTIPLAFDSVAYQPIKDERYSKYDICFVGGWVNNGLNEKKRIMMEHFSEFMESGLNCGFFVNKDLTHEQENLLLYNSKISLNIHDEYQRVLGFDTNERTFKSLGLNGAMVSDTVEQLNRIFPDLKTSLKPKEMVQVVKNYLSLSEKELKVMKEENRQMILDNHCYTNRVQDMLELPIVDTQYTGIPPEDLERCCPRTLEHWEVFKNMDTGSILTQGPPVHFTG